MKPDPWIFALLACAALLGCGSSSSSSQPDDDTGSNGNDAGSDTSPANDAPVDDTTPGGDAAESGPSDVYHAPHPPLPTAKSHGGAVVAHPKIVPVVFDADPLAGDAVHARQGVARGDDPARLVEGRGAAVGKQLFEHRERSKHDFVVREDGADGRIDLVDDAGQQSADCGELMQLGGG